VTRAPSSARKTIMAVFGTRPEAIKMAPVVLALQADAAWRTVVTVTAQHREMLDMVLDLFHITPHHDLHVMQERQTLSALTARVLERLTPILAEERPDLVLVHGDTTTTMAASLACFYLQIPVGHVEAGLRTNDVYNPFPEEMNRRVTSQLTKLYFAPTDLARENLLHEHLPAEHIYVTGNTVIDALLATAQAVQRPPAALLGHADFDHHRIILMTAHRRENWGQPLADICNAIRTIVAQHDDVAVLFPVHRNPVVREMVEKLLGSHPRIHLVAPLDYEPFVWAMQHCYLVLTDSGGMQEEAPAFGKPVLVMRTTTERPEAITAGTARLVGVNRIDIEREVQLLLSDNRSYKRMANAVNPYGDGQAAGRILTAIRAWLGLPGSPFQPFLVKQ